MPNIMLTYRCNLHCPYCFANDYVNRFDTDISEENFDYAVDFIVKGGYHQIGLIGGEPTLHPLFEKFIQKLTKKEGVSSVMLYTNGMYLSKFEKLSFDPQVTSMMKILVNCNSPKQIGEANYKKFIQTMDAVFTHYYMGSNIKFGINLYDNDFDYSYIKEILTRYDQHHVRISLTVPDFSKEPDVSPLDQFRKRKDYLLEFLHEMDEIGVLAYMDCNKVPLCVWTDKEFQWLIDYQKRYPKMKSNLTSGIVGCSPVVDIHPDLRADRCFGMSGYSNVNIRDFMRMADLENYFKQNVDYIMYRIPAETKCVKCYERQTARCSGGCPGYKQKKIEKINRTADEVGSAGI